MTAVSSACHPLLNDLCNYLFLYFTHTLHDSGIRAGAYDVGYTKLIMNNCISIVTLSLKCEKQWSSERPWLSIILDASEMVHVLGAAMDASHDQHDAGRLQKPCEL